MNNPLVFGNHQLCVEGCISDMLPVWEQVKVLTRDGSSQWRGLLSCPGLAAAHTRVIDIHTLHTNTGIHTEMDTHQHSLYTCAQWQLCLMGIWKHLIIVGQRIGHAGQKWLKVLLKTVLNGTIWKNMNKDGNRYASTCNRHPSIGFKMLISYFGEQCSSWTNSLIANYQKWTRLFCRRFALLASSETC